MTLQCVNRINGGPEECRLCVRTGSECAAVAIMKFIQDEYVRRGGDLVVFHSSRKKDGKIKTNIPDDPYEDEL